MGFNTWESQGCNVTLDYVKAAADALVSKGLAAAGYTIVSIDDCWMAKDRNATGHLQPSANFTGDSNSSANAGGGAMAALGDYIHARGLKYGLYESSGTHSCQGLMGSLGYEWVDAQTFAGWGADFLKYDARHDSAVDFCRLKAPWCTAMDWIFISAHCFAIP